MGKIDNASSYYYYLIEILFHVLKCECQIYSNEINYQKETHVSAGIRTREITTRKYQNIQGVS